jgi:micrococcal nuclease
VSALFALHPQGVRRQTLRKGRCVAAGNPPAYPLRVLALRAVLALCLLFLASGATPADADTLNGVVFVVIDGDTVLFKPDHYLASSRAFLKIRLADIDAPEKDQPYGNAASRALTALVLNQRVEVEPVATDTYGRTIARIRKGAVRIDAELVRHGYAWSATRGRRNAELIEVQREARRAQRGLWQDAAPTPPWVWRRAQAASSW